MLTLLLHFAHAQCNEPVQATLACGDSVSTTLDAGWTGGTNPGVCDVAYGALDSSLGGSTCSGTIDPFLGVCNWLCNTGPFYSTAGTCGTLAFGEGPEHVYAFTCPTDGDVTIDLTADCDLDLYVLPDCDPNTCQQGSAQSGLAPESTTLSCIAGETYYISVEGFGFTAGARRSYGNAGAAYCSPQSATPKGGYTLEITCDSAVLEDCDTVGDEDGDGAADCADSDCFDEPTCCDDDGDGYDDIACGGGDCDDTVPNTPAQDADGDGFLDPCDVCPTTPDPPQTDTDGDGFGDACDVCDGAPDDGDADGDGFDCASDCDDADPANFPGNVEFCDGQDNDCNGIADDGVTYEDYWPDGDGDGYGDPTGTVLNLCTLPPAGYAPIAGDCDDTFAATFPGAPELEDGRDNDCDTVVDEGTTRFSDDGDGFTEQGGDCDDDASAVHPAAVEICDGVDNDCDGLVDQGTTCADDDGDSYCEGPTCTAGLPGDCHDGDPAVNPGATEVQGNGIDDDCDGTVDGADPDADGDGFTELAGDCAPADPAVHPAALEVDDGIDNDCDGQVDEGTASTDDDGDGASEVGGDCHDGDPAIFPAATEIENGFDDDCDGLIDEGTDSGDDDGDGFTENGGDCDDTDPDISPGATELLNGIDDDCDGTADEGLTDIDRDGFTEDEGDCNDADGFVNPGIAEVCDFIDNDCDGQVDEGCDAPAEDTATPDSGGCRTAPIRGPWAWMGRR